MKISLPSGKIISGSPDTSILESLKNEGIYLTSSCGGKGTCGKCKIIIRSGSVNTRSAIKLTQEEIKKGYTLACQTFPEGDVLIEIPKESMLTLEGRIATGKSKDLQALLRSTGAGIEPLTERIVLQLPHPSLNDNISDLERLKRELFSKGLGCLRVPFRFLTDLAKTVRKKDWEVTLCIIHTEDCNEITNIFPDNKKTPRYGIAVDIGTTTLVVYLIDLADGSLVDIASTYNSQIRFGDDVITRIVYATEHNGLKNLNKAVITDINIFLSLLKKTHHVDFDSIDQFVIAGNTTMTHLFLGLDPSAIREEPYIPTANSFPLAFAGELGLKINPNTPVYAFPCVASYVGGDIVSGVLAARLHKKQELSLFMDIGTNGEIVLGNSEWLVAAACSAGPCFEGSGIKHGMRATEGAIEDVRINRETLEPEIKIIGDTAPMGICGSGMIDVVAEMFLTGILNQKGKLQQEVSKRIREGEDGLEFVVYSQDDRDIVLTEPDIENIIRAKAAIYAGFSILLKEVGYTFDDIHKVYIAGGFGKFLDIEKAVILGMLPDISREKFEYMGNTSITGAYLCAISRKMREEAEEIARKMTYLELSVSRSFMDEYVSALFIPHTNIDAFSSVKKLMKK
ncbi:MAG: ASKHA domain-containing protein [Thermodesulfovibrionia bacterium]|nr:ASKHA domain-containing protein [Thermodesulfovibrionia bacterium]